jgi:hypothetical protein
MPVCLSAGILAATLATNAFTLAWTHSIEKVRWEEDWRVENAALRIVAARIRGSGAGMEPPPDARLRNGVWQYRPDLPPLESVTLRHSPYAGEYEICIDAMCRPLSERLPGLAAEAVVKIRPCAALTATDR